MIDVDVALRSVAELKQYNDLSLVVLLGGEPGLFPEVTYELTAGIRQQDVAVRIETNAFWAFSKEAACEFLELLYSLNASVMFSLDAFHEPFVSLDYLENAIKASTKLAGEYKLEVPYLNITDRTHPIDRRTETLLSELSERLGGIPSEHIYQGNLLFNGRAADKLAHIVADNRGIPTETCTTAPWWTNGEFETFDLLILDSEGYLSKGCGITIDNVQTTSIPHILENFNIRDHPIFSTLIESGPLGLSKEAEALGYRLKSDYADKCHLCQEVRDILHSHYPEFLVPSQHYS